MPQHRTFGHSQGFGGFACRQTAEEPQLHELAVTRVHLVELLQGAVEVDEVDRTPGRSTGQIVEVGETNRSLPSPSFLGPLLTRVLNQDMTDLDRGNGEEMCSILPAEILLLRPPEVDLVDHRGWLECMPRPLEGELPARHAAQLLHDQWDQLTERIGITAVPGNENRRHLWCNDHRKALCFFLHLL